MRYRWLIALALSVCVVVLGFSTPTTEMQWPDPEKTITVVVPYSAGGGTDQVFRPLIEELKNFTDATVVVSNIGGAGSSQGTNEVLNLPADGYTLLASGTHTVSATLQGLTDGYRQLEGIVSLNWDPFIVAVLKSSPWQTINDLVEAAKASPGSISLGNAGMGGATGVASVAINLAFDSAFNVTPFNGGNDLRASVLGGHADVGIFSQSEILANQDQLRPLVILYKEPSRLPGLETIPTFEQAGLPALDVPGGSFRSVSVKAGTPEDVKQELIRIFRQAYNTESYQSFMKEKGLIPAYFEGNDLDDYFADLAAGYIPVMREAGLLAE